MTMSVADQPSQMSVAFSENLPRTLRAFIELAAMVRSYQPDVVILVARKVPHLATRLSLNFGDSCLVISDLAIPFSHRLLHGARVAVIDDMVNVGSTLRRARDFVRACGAAEVAAFSIGRRVQSQPEIADVHYVISEPLSIAQYDEHTRAVPRLISELAQPYDLSFPVLSCRLQPALLDSDELKTWLESQPGVDRVDDLTPAHAPRGIRRFTVDLPCQSGMNKVRIYINERERRCNIVPFAIPAALTEGAWSLRSAWAQEVYNCLVSAEQGAPLEVALWPGEAKTRAAMFVHALDFGLHCLDAWGDAFATITPEAFSVEDAAMVFGPVVYSIWRKDESNCSINSPAVAETKPGQTGFPSPFLSKFPVSALVMSVQERLQASPMIRDDSNGAASTDLELYQAFNLLFKELGAIVGADDPTRYVLSWPYTFAEVRDNSYLRLRIGPTFDDLVEILRMIVDPVSSIEDKDFVNHFRQRVSALLDRSIDTGSVVPTLGLFDGQFFRIYRGGEGPTVNEILDRICYAVHCRGKAMSLTRIGKIDAILALSRDFCGTTVARPLERGNAGTLPANILDDSGVEAAHYARNIGRLRAVEDEP